MSKESLNTQPGNGKSSLHEIYATLDLVSRRLKFLDHSTEMLNESPHDISYALDGLSLAISDVHKEVDSALEELNKHFGQGEGSHE